jgi:riboflavin biosynthesis pyrimidine reductase
VLSVLAEGGAALHQGFIDEHLWDEARIISGKDVFIHDGLRSPWLKNAVVEKSIRLTSDDISFYTNTMKAPLVHG